MRHLPTLSEPYGERSLKSSRQLELYKNSCRISGGVQLTDQRKLLLSSGLARLFAFEESNTRLDYAKRLGAKQDMTAAIKQATCYQHLKEREREIPL